MCQHKNGHYMLRLKGPSEYETEMYVVNKVLNVFGV